MTRSIYWPLIIWILIDNGLLEVCRFFLHRLIVRWEPIWTGRLLRDLLLHIGLRQFQWHDSAEILGHFLSCSGVLLRLLLNDLLWERILLLLLLLSLLKFGHFLLSLDLHVSIQADTNFMPLSLVLSISIVCFRSMRCLLKFLFALGHLHFFLLG